MLSAGSVISVSGCENMKLKTFSFPKMRIWSWTVTRHGVFSSIGRSRGPDSITFAGYHNLKLNGHFICHTPGMDTTWGRIGPRQTRFIACWEVMLTNGTAYHDYAHRHLFWGDWGLFQWFSEYVFSYHYIREYSMAIRKSLELMDTNLK